MEPAALESATITQDDSGNWHAAHPAVGVSVFADGEAALFKRRAVRPFAAVPRRLCHLVAELDGVRTYVIERDGMIHVVVTKQVLYPEFDDV